MRKLVRDKIPEIIRFRGGRPITHVAGDSEYETLLLDKLAEESGEVRTAGKTHRAEELADVLEIVYALADHDGLSREGLEKIREAKAAGRGGLGGRIVWLGNEEPGE